MAFRYETPYLDLEIYRLLTILEASPALAAFDGDIESDKRKLEFLRGWEFTEISRIVVSLAAIIRSSLDADPVGSGDSYYGLELQRPVGVLTPDLLGRPEKQEPLDFREACNKVIHAKSVEPKTAPASRGTVPPLTGWLVLYGDHRGKDWRADLDLRDYAFAALTLKP